MKLVLVCRFLSGFSQRQFSDVLQFEQFHVTANCALFACSNKTSQCLLARRFSIDFPEYEQIQTARRKAHCLCLHRGRSDSHCSACGRAAFSEGAGRTSVGWRTSRISIFKFSWRLRGDFVLNVFGVNHTIVSLDKLCASRWQKVEVFCVGFGVCKIIVVFCWHWTEGEGEGLISWCIDVTKKKSADAKVKKVCPTSQQCSPWRFSFCLVRVFLVFSAS